MVSEIFIQEWNSIEHRLECLNNKSEEKVEKTKAKSGYDISNFNELYMETIIESHIYVILDEPLIIFKASK